MGRRVESKDEGMGRKEQGQRAKGEGRGGGEESSLARSCAIAGYYYLSGRTTCSIPAVAGQRAIPTDIDPWSRPFSFWNQSWTKVSHGCQEKDSSKAHCFNCGSQSCKKRFYSENAFYQRLRSKAGKPGRPSVQLIKAWDREKYEFVPFFPLQNEEHLSADQLAKKQGDQKAKMHEAITRANDAIEAARRRAHAEGSEEESLTSDDSSSTRTCEEVQRGAFMTEDAFNMVKEEAAKHEDV